VLAPAPVPRRPTSWRPAALLLGLAASLVGVVALLRWLVG
jgi:hypothetical protein